MPSDDDIKCQLDIPGKDRSLIKRAKLIFTPAFGVKTSSMVRKLSLAIITNDIIDVAACFFRHYPSIGGTRRRKFSGRPSTIVIQYFSTLLPYRRRGFGRLVIRKLKEWAIDQQVVLLYTFAAIVSGESWKTVDFRPATPKEAQSIQFAIAYGDCSVFSIS
jgi:GNAT superfamily N-acetyltransferase